MLGQLDWDGVVLPITEVSWSNLLSTASRLQGLDVNEDFFVTYKDEEGDVINVKSEVDLIEAVRWAQEQGVPCLCLHVPFTAAESDSDESWTEIDNGSPRGVTRKAEDHEDDETEQRSILDAGEDAATVEPPVADHPDEEEPQQPPVKEDKEEPPVEEATDYSDEDDKSTEKEEESASDEESEEEEPTLTSPKIEEPVKYEPAVEEQEVEEPKTQNTPTVLTVEPIMQVLEAEAAPVLAVSEPADDRSENTGVGINRIIEIVCSVNDPYIVGTEDKEYFVQLLSEPSNVTKILNFLNQPSVRTAISVIAQAEKASQGAAQKAMITQLIKVLYQNPEVHGHLNAIPNLEELLLRVLRGLAAKSEPEPAVEVPTEEVAAEVEGEEEEEEEVPKVTHTLVTCDGCTDDELREIALSKGMRNESGEILGVRYKSAVLPDFDLCASCESTGRFQASSGPFLKIVDPSTAPEVILCAMPGATAGMLNQMENLDWRNPVAREFFEFVRGRKQRATPQRPDRTAPPSVNTVSAPAVTAPEVSTPNFKCKHLLKTFEAPHGSFSCDVCGKTQPVRAVLHGCRECNFDVCHTCYDEKDLGLKLAQPAAVAPVSEPVVVVARASPPMECVASPPAPVVVASPPAPQAKFVCDVTLTDGCAVRAGESLIKTWRVRNSGQERWPSGTRICHVGGDSFGGPVNGIEVPLAAPGEAVGVSVPLTMPQLPGRYTSYWRMVTPHPQNAKFGHRFWVTVNVMAASVSIAPVPAPIPVAAPRAPPPPPPQSVMPWALPGSPPVAAPAVATALGAQPRFVPSAFEETVARIADFGFTDVEKIVAVLNEVNGDAAAAIERLLEDA